MLACVARLEKVDHGCGLETTIERCLHIRRQLGNGDDDEITVVGKVGAMVGEQRRQVRGRYVQAAWHTSGEADRPCHIAAPNALVGDQPARHARVDPQTTDLATSTQPRRPHRGSGSFRDHLANPVTSAPVPGLGHCFHRRTVAALTVVQRGTDDDEDPPCGRC